MRSAYRSGASGGSSQRWRSRRLPSGCSPTSMIRGCNRRYRKWESAISTPANTPQYNLGADSSVMAKVMPAMPASTRETDHRCTKARGLIKPKMATSTMDASTANGTWRSSGVSTNSATSTTPTENTVAHPVRAPAYRLSAEREKDELVGKAPQKPEASLARPWPIRSWSWSQRWPRCPLSTLALDAVSRKLTSVITSVGSSSWPSTLQPGQLGR